MLEVDAISRGDSLGIGFLVTGARRDRLLPVHVGAELLQVHLPECGEVARGRRRRVHQHQLRDAIRISKRVLQRQHRAPGVPEQCRRLESKMLPHGVEIVEVGFQRDVLGPYVIRAFSAASLVVVDQPKRVSPLDRARGGNNLVSKSGPPWSTMSGWPRPISRT